MSGACALNEIQQVQLRAQILVYGSLLQGSVPEEPLMVGAFSATSAEEAVWDEGRKMWEGAWQKAKKLAETESRFPEPEPGAAAVPVQTMPTATRSALTIQPQQPAAAEPMEIGEDGPDDENDGERERKRAKVSSEKDGIDEVAEKLRKQEHEIERVKGCVDDVELVISSVCELSKSLRPLLQDQAYDREQMVSLKITLEAAYSAANAAGAATAAAHRAALQAQLASNESSLDISASSQDEEPEYENGGCVVGIVVKAVSQAKTALKVGSSLPRRGREACNGVYSQKNSTLEALTEGVTIEVMPGQPGLWLTAKVHQLRNGEVQVEYSDMHDSDNKPVREWLSSDILSSQPPRYRLPYPTFDLNETLDDEPNRWTVGDYVDARLEHSWREGIVYDVENDEVKVIHPDDGCVGSFKSNNIRPSLLWQGDKWVLWKRLYVEAEPNQKEAASSSPDIEICAEHPELGETGPLPNYKMRKLVDVILEETEAEQRRAETNKQQLQQPRKGSSKVNKAKKLIGAAKSNNLQSKLKGHRMLRQFVKLKSSSPQRTSPRRRN